MALCTNKAHYSCDTIPYEKKNRVNGYRKIECNYKNDDMDDDAVGTAINKSEHLSDVDSSYDEDHHFTIESKSVRNK